MWWARLDDRQRDVLSEQSRELTPESLQKMCRDKHPEWAKIRKPGVDGRSVNGRNQPQKKISARERRENEQARQEAHDARLQARRDQRPAQ